MKNKYKPNTIIPLAIHTPDNPYRVELTAEDIRAIRADIAREEEFDRENYREWYEADLNNRKPDLHPGFHTEIVSYLYHGGAVPRRMDCWDAPLEFLEKRGIAAEVLKPELLLNATHRLIHGQERLGLIGLQNERSQN
jgi:hypothetical protein